MTQTLRIVGMVSSMTGRRPFANEDSYIKHVNYCIGIELQKKLSEDKANRMKHQIKIKEEDK